MTGKEKRGWYTSSYTQGSGACVEVNTDMAAEGAVPVRDTKLKRFPENPIVDLSTTGFAALVAHAQDEQI